MYDVIGDIHGHADKLEALLRKLGYSQIGGVYTHPSRKAFFVGDFIDRGPKIKRTLQIVKGMVEAGSAKAVMANHELNLICFLNADKTGAPLRQRSVKNIKQVAETFSQLSTKELFEYSKWFEDLPLWYEDDQMRVVHACWDYNAVAVLKEYTQDKKITLNTLRENFYEGSKLYDAIEVMLKGPEVKMAAGKSFADKDGNVRTEVRVAWWSKETLVAGGKDVRDKVSEDDFEYDFYPKSEKLTFFGHYWLSHQQGAYITAPNAQCLDFSVARGGLLVAYRFDGEKEIDASKFVAV